MADSAAETVQNDGVALADRDEGGAAIEGGDAAAGAPARTGTNGATPAVAAAPKDPAQPAGPATACPPGAESASGEASAAGTQPSDPAGYRLRRAVPARLRRRLSAVAVWSHTPRALRLGTVSAAGLGLITAAALALVGFAGVGTHVTLPPAPPPNPLDFGVSSDNSGFFPQIFYPPPMVFGPPLNANALPPNALSGLVLQPYDVPLDFHATDQGAVPGAAADGLVGSYHVVFQRALGSVDTGELGTATSVLSLAGVYRDVPAAAAQVESDDLGTLGTLAGLPDFVAEPVSITDLIGDETRVVHLTGDANGVPVGVYLVEFRHGAIDGIVAIASPEGSESLRDALQLAQRQESRLEKGEPQTP